MIPTKMLVYRGPNGGVQTETLPNTRRRKKSTGELFQKGYRVRMGHGQVGEKEDQDSIWYSLGGCVHVVSYWGKTWGPGQRWGSFRICVFLLHIWPTVQPARGTRPGEQRLRSTFHFRRFMSVSAL